MTVSIWDGDVKRPEWIGTLMVYLAGDRAGGVHIRFKNAGLRMLKNVGVTGCILLILSACQCSSEQVTTREATDVANGFMTEHLPQVPLGVLRIETVDFGDKWRVIYRFSEGSTGGPIIIDVNKRSGEIVYEEIGQ